MRVGETWTFSTISFPENASDPKITCTSSNPQVASVNGKTITANGVGTTNICITADDNPEVFAIEEITVLSGEIIINKPEYDTITVGTSWQLVNDENVLIRTNKPDVVTIGQNGWITANKSGKVVFELYNQYNPGGFIRYELVISGNVVITGVGSSITMSEGDIQEGLGAYISDGDNVPITWTSSNPDVAEIIVDPVRGTRLFANSAGTTTITAHALDIHSSASFTVYVNKAAVDLIVLYPSINLEDNILYIGETGYITAKNFPYLISVPYTWHQSNNQSIEVIERSSSRVEINPIAEGSTEVWASYYDIVSDPQTVIVKTPKSSIAKSPNAHYMSIGSTFTMRVNSDPGYADVEWNSQNKNVADFDGNVLSAKSTGTTTITATISVGTYVKNISFTLTVGRVTISGPANGELFVGGSRNLSASVTLPSGATSTDIVWSTSNSGIATVSDGKVTGLQAGSVIIRAKYKEDNSLVGMFRFTVRKTKSYIFFIDTPENSLSSNNKLYRTIIANKYYGGNTSYIETIDLKSATYFIQKWNAMGQDGFEIGYVIIECHARATSFGGMADENDSYIFNVSIDYYFQNKNMSGLITTGCNAGFIEEEDNLGVTLSKKVNGAPVIASDGSVRSYYDTEILESLNDDGFKDHLSYYYSDRTTNDGFMVFQQLKINDEIIPERTRTYKLNLLNTTLSELLSRLDRYN